MNTRPDVARQLFCYFVVDVSQDPPTLVKGEAFGSRLEARASFAQALHPTYRIRRAKIILYTS